MSTNRGRCYGLNCECEEFYIASRIDRDNHCECKHSELCHYYKANGVTTNSSQPPKIKGAKVLDNIQPISVSADHESLVPGSKPVVKTVTKPTPQVASGGLTVSQARHILRTHGEPVGLKGRLSPQQMAKAESLRGQ